jgi:dienelactone hydrolase
MEEKVHFFSDWLKLSGFFYKPENHQDDERRPGIIGIHGGSGGVEMYMPPIARRFAKHGYCVLTFYHRGFGNSEGIKNRNIWTEQVRDIRNAITYMQQRPEVDPDRVGLYGTSFGGGTVIYTGGIDQRARCIVEVGGLGNGERWARSKRPHWQWLEFMDELKEDRIRRVMTGQSKRVSYETLSPSGPQMINLFGSSKSYTNFDPDGYPLEYVDEALTFEPEAVVNLISPRAVLFINTERDSMVPADEARSMFAKAGEPKKLVIIPGAQHGDVYEHVNPEIFDQVMKETMAWYDNYLK